MDNEDYINDEELEQQEGSRSYSKKGSPQNSTLDKGKQLIQKAKDGSLKEDFGKVKEGIGKIKSGDKSGIGDIMDGTDAFRSKGKIEELGSDIKHAGETIQKAGDAAKKLGSSMKKGSKAAEKAGAATEKGAKGFKNANKAAEKAAEATEMAGKATKAAGQATKAAGTATKAAGTAASTAGDTINAAGVAADATVVGAPVGAVANVAGIVTSAGGKVAQGAGTATEAAGAATEAAGAATEAAGATAKTAAKAGQAAATGVEQAGKLGKNAGKFGSKFGETVEKFGDSAKKTGEKVKEVGKTVEKVGKYTTSVLKTISNPIKMLFIFLIVFILLIIIFFSSILEPLFGSMEYLKRAADTQEKFNNFILGLGFENSIDAFYEELDYLNLHYDQALNQPLLMATLFYDDVINDQDVTSQETQLLGMMDPAGVSYWGTIYSAIDYFAQESLSETDEMGRIYSANKIFRLKELTKNMASRNGETAEAPFLEYLGTNAETVGSGFKILFDSSFSRLSFPVTLLGLLTKLAIKHWIVETAAIGLGVEVGTLLSTITGPIGNIAGAATYTTVKNLLNSKFLQIDAIENQYLEQMLQNSYDSVQNNFAQESLLIEDILSTFTDIEGMTIELEFIGSDDSSYELGLEVSKDGVDTYAGSWNDLIATLLNIDIDEMDLDCNCDIEYEVYSYDEDAYETYVKEEYIPNMPEFHEFVYDADDELIEDRVNDVYDAMKDLAEVWKELNESADDSAYFDDVCIGDINPNLLDQLGLPIALNEGDEVVFTNKTAFGVTVNGKKHNGVDLNEESVGAHVGDPVYAVYDGRVTYTTGSGDYPGEAINGGGVHFEFSVTYDVTDSEDFNKSAHGTYTIVYEGLDPTRLPEKGASFAKGDIIGYIGDAQFSEDGVTPGLHFEFIDGSSTASRIKYRNPINLFITCSQYDEYSDGVVIHNTSHLMVHEIGLSAADFITATQEYIKTGGRGTDYLKEWDLGKVYKYSVKYNVNPELVVIRAIVEGFSPYSQGYPNYNNYWGVGCYNGAPLSQCSRYIDFEDGVKGFATIPSVLNSDTVEQMMSNYVYIGAVWYDYDHSGTGSGGCHYIEPEYEYLKAYSKERADLVLKTCNSPTYRCSGPGDPGCLVSIDIDQQAHADYNSADMNRLYDEIYADYHTAVASKRVEAYIDELYKIANDNTHGYNINWAKRQFNPDVDCSSLVYYGLVHVGIIPESSPFDTASMGAVLIQNGFTEIRYNPDIVQRGDIVIWNGAGTAGHATTYIGDGKEIAAHWDYDGKPGDGAGDEVSVGNFNFNSDKYQFIYRLEE